MNNPFLNRLSGRDSGHHGRRAEVKAAKRLQGELTPGSGALDGAKGDFKIDASSYSFLVENKTTNGESFSLRRDWCYKIHHEALGLNRIPALSFQFVNGDGRSDKRERWVAIPEAVFKEIFEDCN